MTRVKDKVVVVTGGASGIGLAAALMLAREGAQVAIIDRNPPAQNSGTAFFKADVTNEASVKEAIDHVAARFGRIDVLVNNAGIIGDNKPTHELSEGDWDRVMAVNVKGVFLCTKHAVPHLKKAGGGSIVNLSSVHGLIGSPDYPANHASKGAVRLMSKTDAMLYAKDNIRVNSLHPGYIATPLATNAGINERAAVSSTPLGRMGTAEDVAYAIVYLASDESKFVTASELVVDGGYSGGRM